MNYSDTERITSVLDSYFLEEVASAEDADLVIFNTCSIKQKAEDKVFWVFNNLKKFKEKFPHRKFWVTWCMVKKTWIKDKESPFYSNDELLRRSDLLDFVFRIHDLPKLPEILWFEKYEKEDFFKIQQKLKSPFQAIVPIQTGCDNFCTFCVVPFTRWKENSRSLEEIIRELKIYAKRGVKEIILVGQNVNSYWKGSWISKRKWDKENACWFDWNEKTPFTILLEKVCEIDWIERIKFESSNPHDMTDDIINAIKTLPKISPSLHFALQSWNDEILSKMKRRHNYSKFREICKKLRKWNENFTISTDIIVWFCWETEKQFQDTIKAVEENDFDMIYISQYSERKWTYSAKKMEDNISHKIKSERWHIINEILKKTVKKRLSKLIWKTEKVLIEKIENWICEWKTEWNYICRFKWEAKIWKIVNIKITSNTQWSLVWELV